MKKSEIALVLAAAAARDLRTVGDADVLAWHEDLDGITYPEAQEAVRRHYRESTDRIMPAHIRQHVKVIRDEQRRYASRQEAHRALPGRYDEDPQRDERIARGAQLCHQVLAERLRPAEEEPDEELSPSEQIRQRALERAHAEKRGARPVPGVSSVGDVLTRLRRQQPALRRTEPK